MSLREEAVYAFQRVIESVQELIGGKSSQYIKKVFITILMIKLVVIGFFAYRWYIVAREQAAQKVLSQYLKEYTAIKDGDAEALSHVSALFETGYQAHKSTHIAPYFLAFKADAQVRQGNKADAIVTLDNMITQMSVRSPLLNLFKTKSALLKIDSDDENARNAGLSELTQLGNDTHNKFSDVAMFYQGYYYWTVDQLSQAREVWQQLVERNRASQHAPSPWLLEAQQKLEQIPA